MNEPLLCWMFLLAATVWGGLTYSDQTQEAMKRRFGRCTPFVQWYNVTFIMLLALFLRTIADIFTFEFWEDRLLSWDYYKDNLNTNITGIPLTEAEHNFKTGPLVIPSWIRFLSLCSPIAGLAAFGFSAYQVVSRLVEGTELGDKKHGERFLHMVVLGMPLVYIVMALRATIREWAVMTGSCWLPHQHENMTLDERSAVWADLKAEEKSTYTQDLEVASGFQFFAVWCFGQVCSKALRNVLTDGNAREVSSDGTILLQLGVLGIHSFVILGVIKTVFNMVIAIISSDSKWQAATFPFTDVFLQTFNPVFVFATVLSVINMFLLGRMKRVSEVLPNINMKFNATRALLLIGQGQLTILTAAATDGEHTSKFLQLIHKVSFLKDLEWWFNMNQVRLANSSLLCLECLAVVYVNHKTWTRTKAANAREAADDEDQRRAPLLSC